MANTTDSRPNFSSFPMPISTDSLASSSKPHYNYTYATPSSTPIKPYPSYFYHYRPASPSQRSIRRTSASVPNLCMAASSPPPPPARSSLLSVPPKSYTHSREKPTSRSKLPSADACHPAKREDDKIPSAQPQQSQQPTGAEARQARLIAEHAATVKRMEERQRKAQSQSWFEESQKLATEAARIQQEEFKWADEKLRRIARERDEEERKIRTREQEQERGHEWERPQTRPPPASEWQRDKSRAGVHKGESRYGREQRPEHERAKSEGSSRETGEVRERVKKDRAGPPSSPSSIAAAWEAYQEACTELMHAKPPKGKASGRVTFYDIPWPVLGQGSSFHDLTNEKIAAFLLSPHHSQGKSPKARLRAAILIWHPDKFAQKVFPHIAESHRPAVGAGVDIVARIITELISSQDN